MTILLTDFILEHMAPLGQLLVLFNDQLQLLYGTLMQAFDLGDLIFVFQLLCLSIAMNLLHFLLKCILVLLALLNCGILFLQLLPELFYLRLENRCVSLVSAQLLFLTFDLLFKVVYILTTGLFLQALLIARLEVLFLFQLLSGVTRDEIRTLDESFEQLLDGNDACD